MKLQRIEITGLWHEQNIVWNLNPDVNILIGGNGVGKTTILDLCYMIIPPSALKRYITRKAEKIKLTFDNKYIVECLNFKDSFISLKEKAELDPSYKRMYEELKEDIGVKKSRLNFGIYASFLQFYHDDQIVKPIEIEKIVNVDVVSTFDNPLPKDDDESSAFKELQESKPMSHLDKNLFDCMEAYSYYIGNLANKIEKQALTGNDINTEFIQDVYYQKHTFERIINDLFKDSDKKIDLSKSKPSIILSSGEYIQYFGKFLPKN